MIKVVEKNTMTTNISIRREYLILIYYSLITFYHIFSHNSHLMTHNFSQLSVSIHYSFA
jgi:hypothetical protein